jgi:hypothetical protein
MKYAVRAVVPMALGLAVLCGLLCGGCGRTESAKGSTGVVLYVKSGVTVPDDCQQWLVSFLDAFNAKDGAKILELTAPKDVTEHMARAPEAARKSMADSAMKNVQRIAQGLGDLKSCTVESCKETVFAKDAQPSGPMGAGRYIEMQCEAKCSKRVARASFKLYKKADGTDPIIGLWNLTWSP